MDSSARLPALVSLPTCRTGIIQSWGGSQACWEGCWSLETPTALMLSATFSCPDLPAALLAYKGKCTQRLRPRSGGVRQLTPKPCSKGLYHQEKSQLGLFPNTTQRSLELNRAPAIRTQNTSRMSLCSTSSGLCRTTWGRHSPASYSSLWLVLLLAWEAPFSAHANPCLSCHPRPLQRTPPTMLQSPRSKQGTSSLLTTPERKGVLPIQPPYPITAKRNLS